MVCAGTSARRTKGMQAVWTENWKQLSSRVPTNQGWKSRHSYLVHLSPRQGVRKMENPSYVYFSLMIYLVWRNISKPKSTIVRLGRPVFHNPIEFLSPSCPTYTKTCTLEGHIFSLHNPTSLKVIWRFRICQKYWLYEKEKLVEQRT